MTIATDAEKTPAAAATRDETEEFGQGREPAKKPKATKKAKHAKKAAAKRARGKKIHSVGSNVSVSMPHRHGLHGRQHWGRPGGAFGLLTLGPGAHAPI